MLGYCIPLCYLITDDEIEVMTECIYIAAAAKFSMRILKMSWRCYSMLNNKIPMDK